MSERRRTTYTNTRKTRGPVLRFRFKVVFVIFLLVTAICFVFYMTGVNFGGDNEGSFTATWKERTTEATTEKPEKEKSTEPETTTSDSSSTKDDSSADGKNKDGNNPVPESTPQPESYLSDCVFVGDSITVGLSSYQILPSENVIAEIGMNITKINDEPVQTAYGQTTVLNALIQAQPKHIYIMIGSNGIAWLDVDEMVSEYEGFVDGVIENLPDSDIYFISIPPVTASRENSDQPISNADIDNYNAKLLSLANNKKCHYIDLNSELKGSDGTFPADDAADDGMHFNKSTYDKMIAYVLSHVAQ